MKIGTTTIFNAVFPEVLDAVVSGSRPKEEWIGEPIGQIGRVGPIRRRRRYGDC